MTTLKTTTTTTTMTTTTTTTTTTTATTTATTTTTTTTATTTTTTPTPTAAAAAPPPTATTTTTTTTTTAAAPPTVTTTTTRRTTNSVSLQPLVAGSGLVPQGFSIHSLPGLSPFSPPNENRWLHLCLASTVFGALAAHAAVWGSTSVQCAHAIRLPSPLVARTDAENIYLSWCLFCPVLPPDCFYPAVGLGHALCRARTHAGKSCRWVPFS